MRQSGFKRPIGSSKVTGFCKCEKIIPQSTEKDPVLQNIEAAETVLVAFG